MSLLVGSPWSEPEPYGVLDGGHSPEWFADGDSLLFGAPLRLTNSAVVVQRPGEESRVILDANALGFEFFSWPVLNSDDSRIYFQARHESLGAGIWSSASNGDDVRHEVAFDNPALASVWSFFAMDDAKIYLAIARYESDIHVLRLSWE